MGVFRVWLQEEYVPNDFSEYLQGKVMQRAITSGQAKSLMEAFGVVVRKEFKPQKEGNT